MRCIARLRSSSRTSSFSDLVFAFEFLFADWNAPNLARVVDEAAVLQRVAWVLANHDAPRLATRIGEESARVAAMLLLTLLGAACIYQGDEIGLIDGPGSEIDRAGRDASRHPMQWSSDASGGFTTGKPWLAPVDPETRNVVDQLADPDSLLMLYKQILRIRKMLHGEFRLADVSDEILSYRRGSHTVTLNLGRTPRPLRQTSAVVLATSPEFKTQNGWLPRRSGVILLDSEGGSESV